MPPTTGLLFCFCFWEKYFWSWRLSKQKYVNGRKNGNYNIKNQKYEQQHSWWRYLHTRLPQQLSHYIRRRFFWSRSLPHCRHRRIHHCPWFPYPTIREKTAYQAILSSEHEEDVQEGHNWHHICTWCSHRYFHQCFLPIPCLESLQLPIFIEKS